ncbi:hypothetical protein F4861DRAFT_395774 [Xylaria intraflava]|nr:hypothetical protein F4861DRAFT_395774 [Xylaria intraflava]
MAAVQQLRIGFTLSALLPRLSSPAFSSSFRSAILSSQQSRQSPFPSIPTLAIAIPAAISSIPSLLGDIWEGILRAVPKKKTSHMKKRHRQMAGKALKDVTNLNKCPACGGVKKMHTLCSSCTSRKYSFAVISRTMLTYIVIRDIWDIRQDHEKSIKDGSTDQQLSIQLYRYTRRAASMGARGECFHVDEGTVK